MIAARRSALRGTIFDANGQVLASSQVIDGISRRTYTDAAFSHLIGYASLRFGTTGVERAYDDILTGRADPNPLRDLFNDILARPHRAEGPDPHPRPPPAGLRGGPARRVGRRDRGHRPAQRRRSWP